MATSQNYFAALEEKSAKGTTKLQSLKLQDMVEDSGVALTQHNEATPLTSEDEWEIVGISKRGKGDRTPDKHNTTTEASSAATSTASTPSQDIPSLVAASTIKLDTKRKGSTELKPQIVEDIVLAEDQMKKKRRRGKKGGRKVNKKNAHQVEAGHGSPVAPDGADKRETGIVRTMVSHGEESLEMLEETPGPFARSNSDVVDELEEHTDATDTSFSVATTAVDVVVDSAPSLLLESSTFDNLLEVQFPTPMSHSLVLEEADDATTPTSKKKNKRGKRGGKKVNKRRKAVHGRNTESTLLHVALVVAAGGLLAVFGVWSGVRFRG